MKNKKYALLTLLSMTRLVAGDLSSYEKDLDRAKSKLYSHPLIIAAKNKADDTWRAEGVIQSYSDAAASALTSDDFKKLPQEEQVALQKNYAEYKKLLSGYGNVLDDNGVVLAQDWLEQVGNDANYGTGAKEIFAPGTKEVNIALALDAIKDARVGLLERAVKHAKEQGKELHDVRKTEAVLAQARADRQLSERNLYSNPSIKKYMQDQIEIRDPQKPNDAYVDYNLFDFSPLYGNDYETLSIDWAKESNDKYKVLQQQAKDADYYLSVQGLSGRDIPNKILYGLTSYFGKGKTFDDFAPGNTARYYGRKLKSAIKKLDPREWGIFKSDNKYRQKYLLSVRSKRIVDFMIPYANDLNYLDALEAELLRLGRESKSMGLADIVLRGSGLSRAPDLEGDIECGLKDIAQRRAELKAQQK
jgi:hypothetical protein